MAATVSLLGTATFNTTSGTKTVTATPAVGDLIVIVTAHSGNTSTAAPTDNNSGGGGTYTLINTAVKATSADTMKMWVRDSLITSATSTVFTHAPGTTTGGGLVVIDIQGMDKVGATAIVRSAIQSNQAAGTPAPVLGAVPSSLNPIIGAVFNASNPATMTPRSGYSEIADVGYNTPATGLEVMSRNSGETSATITWGSASATAYGSIAVELDSRVTHATTGTLTGQIGSIVGSAAHIAKHGTSGALSGQGSEIVGAADRESASISHATTGALTGQGSSVVGSASRIRAFASSGTLTGQGSAIVGSADREPLIVPHTATGSLVGQGSLIVGSAAHKALHTTTGALVGQGSTLSGLAARWRAFATSGSLTGQGSVIVGDADHEPQALGHVASGDLVGPGSVLYGEADRGENPNPPFPDKGDVGGRHWTKKEIKKRDREFEAYKREKSEFRKLIKKTVQAATKDSKTIAVVENDEDSIGIVPVIGPAIKIAVPPLIDVAEVAKIIAQTVRQANATAIRVKAYKDAERALAIAKSNVARIVKRRREEEFLLLMD